MSLLYLTSPSTRVKYLSLVRALSRVAKASVRLRCRPRPLPIPSSPPNDVHLNESPRCVGSWTRDQAWLDSTRLASRLSLHLTLLVPMKWKYVNRQRKLALAIKTGNKKKQKREQQRKCSQIFPSFLFLCEAHIRPAVGNGAGDQVMPPVGFAGMERLPWLCRRSRRDKTSWHTLAAGRWGYKGGYSNYGQNCLGFFSDIDKEEMKELKWLKAIIIYSFGDFSFAILSGILPKVYLHGKTIILYWK